ncbi:MAG: AAA family ATPase [Bacteroidota bacterium]
MPTKLTIPFYAIKLHLQDGDTLTLPISDTNAIYLKKSTPQLAKKYKTKFQEKLLDKGRYISVLDEIQEGEFIKSSLSVSFPAAKDGMSFQAFSLEFEYFHKQNKDLFWGIVPSLGIESIGASTEELTSQLQEAIKVDFTSRKRLAHVQHILSTMWFANMSVEKTETNLNFYTPGELLELQKVEKRKLLPRVASKLKISHTEAYGREKEINQLERILNSNFSKNILLVGASGSGKTALIWELAFRRKNQKKKNAIWETTASVLIKELTDQTGWQDNLSLLVSELTLEGDFLFVRNLSELFEVGQYEGNPVSMAEYLRPYISRGELTLVSECTPEERARIEVRSPNFLSFFQVVQLEEPKKGLEDIILQKVTSLAGKRKVVFEPDAIEEVIRLHRRFSPYSGMPGKPIRFLESMLLTSAPDAPKKKNNQKKTGRKLPDKSPVPTQVSRRAVLRQYSNESGMPLFMIDPGLPMNVAEIKRDFNQQVFGQKKAVNTVIDLLAAVKTALTRTGKPIASFLFVGPTGVGKTELAKVLSEFMFSSRDRLLRFDMSEYSDPVSVMRLTGQGYFSEGLLTSAVRREPFCVLLFDEIEKADPTFYDLLLQIIGEGRLSDSQGKLVNFCSAIIIMTSNIGASKLQSGRIGWKKEIDTEEVTGHFIREVEKNFKPELYNRIDSVVAFEPLSKETVRSVVDREITLFKKREGIHFRRLDLELEDAVLDHLSQLGYEPKYGARYLQRAIREKLIIPLAYTLNQYEHDDQLIIKVIMENGEIALHTSSDPLAFDLLMEQWDKLTLAEQTSNYRRKMMMMQEGPIYMRMHSELDLMENDKKLDEPSFWSNRKRSNLYTSLLDAREKTAALYDQIKQYEIEIALAAMEQGDFETNFENRLETWHHSYFDQLIQIYSLLFPENNTCYLNIYGIDFGPVLDFYLQLVKRKGFEIKNIQAVWHREGFNGIDDDNPYLKPNQKSISPYIKRCVQTEDVFDIKQLPPAKGDRLYGIELILNGNASAVYFHHENGTQQWELAAKEPLNLYHISTSNQYAPTPPNIVRQQFYQKPKPRRTVRLTEFSDTQMNIQAQVKQKELAAQYAETLDEIFKKEAEKFFY